MSDIISVKYRDKKFEIRRGIPPVESYGWQAGQIKKEGSLRCFYVLGSEHGDPKPCFDEIVQEIVRLSRLESYGFTRNQH